MAETIHALFRWYDDADKAVKALQDAGIDRADISIIAPQSAVPNKAASAEKGALGGGVVGGLLGLLAGVGAIAIPGIGPVIAAGALASALGGAGVGAGVGGLLGALRGENVKEDDAQVYAEGVERGDILVQVRAEGPQADTARTVLKSANALNVETLRSDWQRLGWNGLDESDRPDDPNADLIMGGTHGRQ